MEFGIDAVKQVLASLRPRTIDDPSRAHAAVLMPFLATGPDPLLLLTRRTDLVRYHKGQVSFPGGAQDGTEPLETTALRETEEEIGIHPDQVELLGRFHEYLSSSNYRVTPFVASVSAHATIKPNPIEVARVLRVPISFFIENQPGCRIMERRGQKVTVYFYQYQDEVIWGLTARIVKEFVDLLKL